jgi:hypothetical protein
MNIRILMAALAACTISACTDEAEEPSAADVEVTNAASEQAAAEAAARIEEIQAIDDPDELLAIMNEDGMFTDTGKAADKRLQEVLAPRFAEADSEYDVYQLKKYTKVPGSTLMQAYDERMAAVKDQP